MKTSGKLSQISFIIAREFRAISTSYAEAGLLWFGSILLVLFWFFIVAFFREPRRVNPVPAILQQDQNQYRHFGREGCPVPGADGLAVLLISL